MTEAELAPEAQPDAPSATLRIAGEMTIYRAAELKDQLLAQVRAGSKLALDLAEVSEIDSSGIQLLALAQREAEQLGLEWCITACSDPVVRLLSAFNLADKILAEIADQENCHG